MFTCSCSLEVFSTDTFTQSLHQLREPECCIVTSNVELLPRQTRQWIVVTHTELLTQILQMKESICEVRFGRACCTGIAEVIGSNPVEFT